MRRQLRIPGHFERLEQRIAASVALEPSRLLPELQANEKLFRTDTLLRIARFLGGEFRQGVREVRFKVVDTYSRAWALTIRLKVRGPSIDFIEWKDAPEIIIQGNKRQFSSVEKMERISQRTQPLAVVIENALLTDLQLMQDEIVLHTPDQLISLRKGCQGTTEIVTSTHR